MTSRTILIVDDDKIWLRSISGFFTIFGYEVLTAPDCAEGFGLASRRHPDCVLMDYHLPDGDAGSFCARLRSDQDLKRTPIIIVSADGEQEYCSYLKHQADGFVLKGGPLNSIRMLVESILRRIWWERGIIEKGDLRLETENLTVFRDSKPLARLTLEQFRFLFIIMERSPAFVSEDNILKFIFDADIIPEKHATLRVLADSLRAKLGARLGRRIKNKNAGWIYLQPPGDNRRASASTGGTL
ncbi:MAG TPA: hypothetical protein DCS63_04680 [Elusimicrobia bacterium]|nr:hypothetical protein [Elusimicrobiota bacterium]